MKTSPTWFSELTSYNNNNNNEFESRSPFWTRTASVLLTLVFVLHFQLISSKVPKAEYVPTIIRRDDPSIIPILYVSRLKKSSVNV